jgi:SpoVK/Ycf46/Vps4 family AAA+-type ATPase
LLIGPRAELPEDLQRDVALLEVPLPEAQELEATIEAVIQESPRTAPLASALGAQTRATLARAALGLTQRQAVEAFRKALAGKTALDDRLVQAVIEEKRQLVRRAAALDFMDDVPSLDDVGGLENLKAWLRKRLDAIAVGLGRQAVGRPKGLLLTGVSGCGKSLCCKAVASHWRIPLLRFNMANLYAGDQDASPEEALRLTIRIAETVAPCVLWIDEIEAGVSINTQKAGQGSASRVLASLLNWMQEKSAFVFVAATANVIDLLPPEVLRKGRFDEIFFVGLPRQDERLEILRIHLRRAGQDPDAFDLEALAKSTTGFNGAEIEQLVSGALVESLHTGRPLSQEDLVITAGNIVPLSVTMREEIGRMERWAHSRAVMASGPKRTP